MRVGYRDDRVRFAGQLNSLRSQLPLAPWRFVDSRVVIPDVDPALLFLNASLAFNFH